MPSPSRDATNPKEPRGNVEAWSHGGVLLEAYRYSEGADEAIPMHSHEAYQIGLGPDCPAEYGYRGARHGLPSGALSVIHPGEAHSTREIRSRRAPTRYRMMYVEPAVLRGVATELAGREKGEPFFPDPVVLDEGLARLFWETHSASGYGGVSSLERDSSLLSVLAQLVLRHAEAPRPSPGSPGEERRAVRAAKDYLRDNLSKNVSLEELSRAANLSPSYLTRVFAKEVGVPPHRYQLQARIDLAKDLLVKGWPAGRVAQEAGFYDQSHFSRRFERLVGVPPGRYARRGQ